jgi:hypothetical protein
MSFGTTTPTDWRLDDLQREIDQGSRRIQSLEARIEGMEDRQRRRDLRVGSIQRSILSGLIAVTWALSYGLILAALVAAHH